MASNPLTTAASDKTHGYVTEITYPFNYYRELNPNTHALALTASGIAGRALGAPMVYIELGCGLGLSTLVHAAANPQAQFFGLDLNPDHINVARDIAATAGLANVTFLELAFEDMEAAGLPQFDTIAMHGVWSWINQFNRDVILRFIDRHLTTGGVVYSSYNAQPGYSAIMPLRELMMIGYRQADGSIADKVSAGLAFGQRIKSLNATYFRANPLLGQYLDDIMPLSPNYLAHEYFNADWWSFHFSQIVAQHEPLGLTFGGSARLLDHIDALNFTPGMREALGEITDSTARETLKDFFLNCQFRRDLFVRDATRLSNPKAMLMDVAMAAAVLPANVHRVAGTTMLGEIRPQADAALAVATALAEGPASTNALMKHPAAAGMEPDAVLEAVLTMAALGAAEPAMPASGLPARKVRTDRLNTVLWERSLTRDEVHATASPVTGGAVGLPRMEQLFLLARHRGVDATDLVVSAMPGENRTEVNAAYEAFVAARIPLLRNLGIGN
ncbi:MAG: methyltransferase domain-containing protein [Rhodospirillaceae bacterium]|nr:MAG: methyltransferase domain-containing protein [Rhodospirillaceae bacterium]